MAKQKEVFMTRDFDTVFRQLQPRARKIVEKRITQLLENPSYPSLHAHRLTRSGGQIWECYINRGHSGMRLLYENCRNDNTFILWNLGGHDILDKARLTDHEGSMRLLRWEQQQKATLSSVPKAEVPFDQKA